MSERKSTSRAKLKAARQKEQTQMWKEHFKNLPGNSPKVTDKPFTKIINCQLDIKLGQFTEEEINVAETKILSRKAASLNEIPAIVWKTWKFDDLLLQFCFAICK